MKNVILSILFVFILGFYGVEAAQSGFGGASRSSSSSGGRTSSSFGGSSLSSRSSMPTRTSSSSSFGSSSSKATVPSSSRSSFGGSSYGSAGSSQKSSVSGSTPSASGSSRSSFGGSSLSNRSSIPTRSSSSSFGGSSASSSLYGSSSSSYSRPVPATKSYADIQLESKARSSGTYYGSRDAAESSFRQRYSTTYTSHYSTPPSVWPTHIPHYYSYSGNNYNIIYNPTYGGYGYYYGSRWFFYDVMSDAIMMNTLMSRNNYAYEQPVTYVNNENGVTYVHDNGGFGFIIGLSIFVCLIFFVGVLFVLGQRN